MTVYTLSARSRQTVGAAAKMQAGCNEFNPDGGNLETFDRPRASLIGGDWIVKYYFG